MGLDKDGEYERYQFRKPVMLYDSDAQRAVLEDSDFSAEEMGIEFDEKMHSRLRKIDPSKWTVTDWNYFQKQRKNSPLVKRKVRDLHQRHNDNARFDNFEEYHISKHIGPENEKQKKYNATRKEWREKRKTRAFRQRNAKRKREQQYMEQYKNVKKRKQENMLNNQRQLHLKQLRTLNFSKAQSLDLSSNAGLVFSSQNKSQNSNATHTPTKQKPNNTLLQQVGNLVTSFFKSN